MSSTMQSEELSMQRLSGDEDSSDEPLSVSAQEEAGNGGAAGGSADEAADNAPDGNADGAAGGSAGGPAVEMPQGGAKRRRIMHTQHLGVGRPNHPVNHPARGRLPEVQPIVCLEVKEMIPLDDIQGANELPPGSCIGYAIVMRNPDEGAHVVEEFGYVPPAPQDPNDEESDASGSSEAKGSDSDDDDEKELVIDEIMKCIIAAYDKAVIIPDQK